MSDGARTLTGSNGQRFRFDAGNFCLELLLTGGPGVAAHFEILDRPDEFVRWLTESKLTVHAPLTVDQLRIKPKELARIVEFRDVMWGVACELGGRGKPGRKQLKIVNDAVGAPPRPWIDPDTGVRGWNGVVTGEQVLAAAAREAVDLITTDLGERVRVCGGDNCHLVFLDTSRPGTRRWCSMQRCGNRNKVNTYRSQSRESLSSR